MAISGGLTVASTFAQTQSTTSSSTTYIQTSKLVGKKVKSSQGDEIGVVKDVVLDGNRLHGLHGSFHWGRRRRDAGPWRRRKMVAVPVGCLFAVKRS